MTTKYIQTIVIAIFALISLQLNAQNCEDFFPMDEGKSWVMSHFNAKSKLTGKTLQKIISKQENNGVITSTIQIEHENEKGKKEMSQEYEVNCAQQIFKISAKSLIPQESMQSMESMETTMDLKDLEMPTTLIEGENLPDGSITVKASMNGINVMNLTILVTNRKIVGKESITTDAGTFECFKITEATSFKMGFMNQTSTSTTWFCPGYGVIKSEVYDKNGKLDSYSIMSKFN